MESIPLWFSRCAYLGVFLAGFSVWTTGVKGETRKPNILFISIDDLNDWVGAFGGHVQAKTPHIDRLAQEGVLFLNAHCQAPLCNPSRTSLLTGLRPSTTGIYGLAPWFRSVEEYSSWVTLPQTFMKAGYQVLTTGKTYHDAYPPLPSRKDGEEFSVWGHHGGHWPRPEKKFVDTPDKIALMDWGVFPERDEDQDDYKIASWALDRMETGMKEPFLLMVGFRRPHVPCYASQKWFDLYPEDELVLPPVLEKDREDIPDFAWYLHWKLPEPRLSWLRKAGEFKSLVRAYLASVSFMDSQVGRLLDGLEKNGLKDNTLIVLWSDHGWHLGEKGITGKNTLWERSTRVPLIMAGPGVVAGGRCSRPVELLDIFPTLLEWCGLEKRPELEGHSLGPLLRNPDAARPWPAITTHNQGNHGIRSERWRYIRYADGSEELYDLLVDPHEWVNLAGKEQFLPVLEEHRQWLPEVDRPPVPGSAHRVLTYQDGVVVWEGKEIIPAELEE